MEANLLMADILHLTPSIGTHRHNILQEEWSVEHFAYEYRSSSLKRQPSTAVVLSATLKLTQSTPAEVQAKMEKFSTLRRSSQPAGASLGSIFSNPTGDYAGRLIEAAGLKGTKKGKVEISQKHANFFINQDGASAADYASLIRLAQAKVKEKFDVSLELEIELIGDWTEQ
jgi:UDP-N-acetylmuramate dehydrogenase